MYCYTAIFGNITADTLLHESMSLERVSIGRCFSPCAGTEETTFCEWEQLGRGSLLMLLLLLIIIIGDFYSAHLPHKVGAHGASQSRASTHARTHTNTHARTHMHTHTCTHTRTHMSDVKVSLTLVFKIDDSHYL